MCYNKSLIRYIEIQMDQASYKELIELRDYKKRARYVMAKLHREKEELELINKELQRKINVQETPQKN